MKRHRALFVIVTALGAVAVAMGAQSATADLGGTNHAYACYSSVADPVLASADDGTVFATWSTYGSGYFAPWAESSTPTNTPIPGGWYLTCAVTPGWAPSGSYILGDGSKIVPTGPTDYLVNSMPIPGVYAVIQAAPAPAGS